MDTPNLPALAPALPAETSPAQRLLAAWLSGRSPTTIRAYSSDAAAFAAWAGDPDAAAAAARLLGAGHGAANELALRWRSSMLDAGLSSATVNRRLAALRSLVGLANVTGMIPWSLNVAGVKSEKRRDSRGPGTAGVRKLIMRAGQRGDAKGIRDVAILRLLYDRGLRRAELCRLSLGDFDKEGRRISVQGKGKREKSWLPLYPKAIDALTAWMHVRPIKAGDNPEAPLFVNLDNAAPCARLSVSGLYVTVRDLGKSAGMKLACHKIRHSAITAFLDASKGDVREARKFARHADIRTTVGYDDSDDQAAEAIAKKLSDNL